ncbi:MAG: precorrin-8X methylmutase [Chloroflexi bacterium]|nr:precorrin-8X methylmutase [Chloroflexota bacterium]
MIAEQQPPTNESTGGDSAGYPALPGPLLRRYALPGEEIERRSMAQADTALATSAWQGNERRLAARLIYAVGDPTIAHQIAIHPQTIPVATTALRRGVTIYCDVKMVASGISHRLAGTFHCAIFTAIDDPDVYQRSQRSGLPRAAEAMRHLSSKLNNAIVVIGNAPTALLAILDLATAGIARPSVIVGIPVGFVAATEAKEALITSNIPYVTVRGARGGTPLAVAAINMLLTLAKEATDG